MNPTAKAEMENMLCANESFMSISKYLRSKYDIKLSQVAIREYHVKHFQNTEEYKQAQASKAVEKANWEKGLMEKKALIEAKKSLSNEEQKRVGQAISTQIDGALADLYYALGEEKIRPFPAASTLAGIHREIRAYLEFKGEFLKSVEVDRERRTILAIVTNIVAELITKDESIDTRVKKRFLEEFETRVRATLKD
jgi:hypothetical protein